MTNLSNKIEIVNFKNSIDEHIKKEKTNIKVYYVGEKSLVNCVITLFCNWFFLNILLVKE